jgi:hypothetical protein
MQANVRKGRSRQPSFAPSLSCWHSRQRNRTARSSSQDIALSTALETAAGAFSTVSTMAKAAPQPICFLQIEMKQRFAKINPRQRHADAPRVGSAAWGTGNRAPVQRNAFRQLLCLVLAKDRCRSHIKASPAGHQLRQLWDRVELDLRVKPRDPEASIRIALLDVQCPRCELSRWRGIRASF